MKHLERILIWRDATLLLTEIESAVREFPRYHKYTLGSELRANTMKICQTVHRAVSRQQSRTKLIQQLTELIDDL